MDLIFDRRIHFFFCFSGRMVEITENDPEVEIVDVDQEGDAPNVGDVGALSPCSLIRMPISTLLSGIIAGLLESLWKRNQLLPRRKSVLSTFSKTGQKVRLRAGG